MRVLANKMKQEGLSVKSQLPASPTCLGEGHCIVTSLYGGSPCGRGEGSSRSCDLWLTNGDTGRVLRVYPLMNRKTSTTENITFSQLHWRAVRTEVIQPRKINPCPCHIYYMLKNLSNANIQEKKKEQEKLKYLLKGSLNITTNINL